MRTLELPAVELFREETISHYRETVENYAQWSPEGNLHFGYWRWGLNPFSRKQMLAEMNRIVIDALTVESNAIGPILDLGCGVGAMTRWGANYRPGLSWIGVNISKDQLRICNQRTSNTAIQFVCEDYHRLSFPRGSASGAYFVESLCYSNRPELALAEAARVLKPHARIVITDGYLRKPLEQSSTLLRYLHGQVARNWAVPKFHTLDQVLSQLPELGLKLVECRDLSWRISVSALHSLPLTAWCATRLLLRRKTNASQWKHLLACAHALILGLQRSNFGYYLLVLEKS